mgnify:CR=1 FL=1
MTDFETSCGNALVGGATGARLVVLSVLSAVRSLPLWVLPLAVPLALFSDFSSISPFTVGFIRLFLLIF